MFDAQQITEWTTGQLAWHMQHLHMRLFWGSEPVADPPYSIQVHQARESSPLREEIALLCRAANGAIDRATAGEQLLGEIAETVQSIAEATAGPPLLNSYTIADAYFDTPIGELVAAVMAWLRGDDLISFAEAARLLWPGESDADARQSEKKTIARVRRMAERGELRRYRNPTPDAKASGPWLVSRQEIEAYIADRRAETNE